MNNPIRNIVYQKIKKAGNITDSSYEHFGTTNKIYVANSGSNSVSVIDGFNDKIAAGVTFNVNPTNSGSIVCNNIHYPMNQYLYSSVGTRCIAKPNKNFEFSSWVENLSHNSESS